MTGIISRAAVASLVAFGLGACSTAPEVGNTGDPEIYDRNWVADTLEGRPVTPGVVSSLVIDSDGKVSGNAGCNDYFGSVIVDEDAMSFGNLGATSRACPAWVMGQEDRMLRVLDSTRGYRLEAQALLLLDASGNTVARLSAETGA